MFRINNSTKMIEVTRGDIADICIGAVGENGTDYIFQVGDIIRLGIYTKKNYNNLQLQKDITILEESTNVVISLTSKNTKIGNITDKYVDYWYEIELNPDTNPQTIIGHDEKGAKIFRVYPEGVEE